jgi:pimeloyl-ACP methyl ester carboxylesterase
MLIYGSRLRIEMQAAFIAYGSSRIHYYYLDRGSRLMVCFHGYDENGSGFGILQDVLPPDCSLLSLDLPLHGATQWNETSSFTPTVLWEIISRVCGKHGRPCTGVELAGFSMGGRVALALLEYAAEHIAKVVLFAPDGLRSDFWYSVATANAAGRGFFRFTMSNAHWLLLTLRFGRKMSLINQSIFKFSYHYLKDPQSRQKLYDRWVVMRHMRPSLNKVKSAIRKFEIPVLLIYGSSDRIMPAQTGRDFCRDTDQLCKVETIACGHQILQPRNRKNLTKIFRRLKF